MTPTVVITGASAGIGRAVAQCYGRRGANVAVLARGQAGLRGAARDVEDAGGRALAIPTDVADYAAVADAADRAAAELGPIDTWINAAFTSVFAPFVEISPEEFKRVTEVCYLGFVYGTMAALAKMKPRDLARTGYGSQQTDQRARSEQPHNLWQPLDQEPGSDHGVCGEFDESAHGHSPQMWVARHGRVVAGRGHRPGRRRRGAGHPVAGRQIVGGRPRTSSAPATATAPITASGIDQARRLDSDDSHCAT